ncbi:MAG: hypothetical protein P4M12_04115 [Gammaproteobacteria bacterium]|nr:hypothetical protein [Gammaproteobacteria bacterium]
MIRKSILLFSLLCTFCLSSVTLAETVTTRVSTLACGQALPVTNPSFCSSFQVVAQCHCTASGLPAGMCNDMNLLYQRMISMFGSIQRACEYQHDTSIQNCINDWSCYRNGGTDNVGGLCSSTGRAC